MSSDRVQAYQPSEGEQMAMNKAKHAYVLHPDSRFRAKWDIAQVCALVYVALLVPTRTGFGIEIEPFSIEWWVELVADMYFTIDIVINFRTGFRDENGSVETRPKQIARSYLKTWLIIDVVSCLPISYITQILQAVQGTEDEGGGANVKIFKVLRLLRLAKLLRLGRLKKIIKRHEEEIEGLMGIVKVTGVVSTMGYICHLLACGWYYVGSDVEVEGLAPQRGWIYNQMDDVWNATNDRKEISFGTMYITCYYWAITTISTVGYGDITGQTNTERLYLVLAEMVGCLMFAMLTGALGSMMVSQKLLEQKVDNQLSELREFMESKGIPKDLRIKVRRYMEVSDAIDMLPHQHSSRCSPCRNHCACPKTWAWAWLRLLARSAYTRAIKCLTESSVCNMRCLRCFLVNIDAVRAQDRL